jgi:large subunit ribosomal protein L29
MSKKKTSDKVAYDEQSVSSLREHLVLFKKELFNLRFQKVLGELKNTSRFSVVRKNIARIKTALSKKAVMGGSK